MHTPVRVLVLEDQPADAELMVEELRRGGFDPAWQRVETEKEYVASLDAELSVVLADYSLPQFDAARALHLLQERGLDIPFIVVSGAIGEETAVEIMKQGAADYLLKDRLGRLAPAVAAALEKERLRKENRTADAARRRAEERYREIFENTIEGIFQITPQGHVLAVNPALATMFGYLSPEELMAAVQPMGVERHVDPDVYAQFVRLLEENGQVRGFEGQVRRKDRTMMWVSANARAVRDESNVVTHYDGTLADITEGKANQAALYQYQEELRDLAARLISAHETESKRLGRELHDVFSQKLAVMGMELGLLRAKPPDSPSVLRERLALLGEQVTELATGLHQTARGLHPAVLDDIGLLEALRHECAAFAEQSGIQVRCTGRKLPLRIPDDASLCLYRVTQESLRNIRNHAHAREARVDLWGDGGEIVLRIEDDGRGFVRDAVRGKGGLGLVSMEERIRLVSGSLSITQRRGGGTRVEVRVPLAEAPSARR